MSKLSRPDKPISALTSSRFSWTECVRDPGPKVLPQGASLDQAIASAGGQKLIRGQVEFIRFTRDGKTDKRKFFISGTILPDRIKIQS